VTESSQTVHLCLTLCCTTPWLLSITRNYDNSLVPEAAESRKALENKKNLAVLALTRDRSYGLLLCTHSSLKPESATP
jgi:hypothetical protein